MKMKSCNLSTEEKLYLLTNKSRIRNLILPNNQNEIEKILDVVTEE
jgi:hypothetical protein